MIELEQILTAIRRWWWLAVIPVAVVLAYTGATYQAPATYYQVTMRFVAGGQPASALSSDYDRYYAWLSSEYIANALADLAVTERFARTVADRLSDAGLSVPPAAIQAATATDNAQSVMMVYVTWPNPAETAIIAETIGSTLLESGPSYYPQMDGIGQVARLADAPAVVELPPSLRARLLGPALRVLIAAGLGLGLVLLANFIDPRIRSCADVEASDLTLLGTIPRLRRADAGNGPK